MKLSAQETKDLNKYTKFFALKSAQAIVQARIGVKNSTPCKPNNQGTDWFNLNIIDLPEVNAESKKALNGGTITSSSPFVVEISLRTPEGDQMVLESWCLNLLPEQCDPSLRNIPSVYNRMGLLIKSLLSVTKVTPAYRYSRRQGVESYVMCYRIYMDQPALHNLGEGYKQMKVGQIGTAIGTLQFSVWYRTKMTISPTQSGKTNSIMVKSDHFNSNSNTRRHRNNNDDINDLTKPMRPGPFADPKPKKPVEPQLPGVTRLLAMGKYKPRPTKITENESLENSRLIEDEVKENEREKEIDKENEDSNSPTKSVTKMTSSNSSRISIFSNLKSVDEDYWMQELSAPFATRGPVGELMQFYKQCKKSPPLQSPQKNPSPEEITRMIEMFESQLPEYDALVQSFCESPDNN